MKTLFFGLMYKMKHQKFPFPSVRFKNDQLKISLYFDLALIVKQEKKEKEFLCFRWILSNLIKIETTTSMLYSFMIKLLNAMKMSLLGSASSQIWIPVWWFKKITLYFNYLLLFSFSSLTDVLRLSNARNEWKFHRQFWFSRWWVHRVWYECQVS